jgi:C-terminal processing protease CtpA/Prc
LTGVILDLRVAGPSATWPLLEMLTLFADGAVGEFYTRVDSQPLEVAGVDVAGSQDLPLVLLIGADTRGLPEVFAGVLQGAGRATLVGLPTAGDTEGFSEVALPDGSRLTLATSSVRLPDGTDFSVSGLSPDVLVDQDWDTYTTGENDPVLRAAVAELIP